MYYKIFIENTMSYFTNRADNNVTYIVCHLFEIVIAEIYFFST